VLSDDSSRKDTGSRAQRTDLPHPVETTAWSEVAPEVARSEAPGARSAERSPAPPVDADEALRLAIKAAVDAGDYDRAAALVDVAKRTTKKPASVSPIVLATIRPRR
jgi:hypothetical protein